MAVTQLTLVLLSAMALFATVGMFVDFDDATTVLVSFAAAILWGTTGLSSYDVIMPDPSTATESYMSAPVEPLVYLGFGFAMITALFAIYELVRALGSEAKATRKEDMI